MKILFDQNLSHRLVDELKDEFPDSTHVRDVGLATSSDATVWEFAAHGGYVIASKDTDFEQRALLFGPPPKVIWVRLGNCSTADIAELLRSSVTNIQKFEADASASFLALS